MGHMPDSRHAWRSNRYFIVFAAKGTLSEDTIRLFLRQLGKFIIFFRIFSIYLCMYDKHYVSQGFIDDVLFVYILHKVFAQKH